MIFSKYKQTKAALERDGKPIVTSIKQGNSSMCDEKGKKQLYRQENCYVRSGGLERTRAAALSQ